VKSIVDPLPEEKEKQPYLPNGSSDKAFKPKTFSLGQKLG
jgi:hypothetical protein